MKKFSYRHIATSYVSTPFLQGAANFYPATAEFFATATDFCSLNIPSFIA